MMINGGFPFQENNQRIDKCYNLKLLRQYRYYVLIKRISNATG